MKTILNFIITSLIILLLARILPGIHVSDWWTALGVALVLSFLNFIVKPVLIILTLPLTLITLGFFLLVINAIIILLAGSLIDGFNVNGFWSALLFSVILSFIKSIIDTILLKSES